MLDKMKLDSVDPSLITYNALFSELSKIGQMDRYSYLLRAHLLILLGV